jgi:Tfp pilus assembly PilM family ATPase
MINTVTKNYGIDNEFVSYQVTYVDSNRQKSVPLDEANTDYQVIQEWIKEGGTVIDNPPQENN